MRMQTTYQRHALIVFHKLGLSNTIVTLAVCSHYCNILVALTMPLVIKTKSSTIHELIRRLGGVYLSKHAIWLSTESHIQEAIQLYQININLIMNMEIE